MHLEHLSIQGFKSFANKTVIDFKPAKNTKTHGITAVVGPNGSGKSNVVDAIRWVLGEQSAKQLRGKKIGDVIFSGTEKKSKSSSAMVSLKLNNSDQAMDIGYSEVELSRQLFRNGDSDYLINENKSRLSDISYLLAKAHIGQKSYTVIGQGMIDTVLNSTPTERKDFFDEAAGIKQFQIKKDQAVSKLDQAEENLTHGTVQLQEITPRLKSLTRQMKRYEEREIVLQALDTTLNSYYAHHWKTLQKNTQNEIDTKLAFEKEREILQTELDNLQAQMKQLAEKPADSTNDEALRQTYEDLLQKKQILFQKRSQYQQRLDASWAKQGKHRLGFIQERITTLTQSINSHTTTIAEQETKLSHAQKEQTELQSRYTEQVEAITKIQKKLFSELQTTSAKPTETIATLKEKILEKITIIENHLTTALKNQESSNTISELVESHLAEIKSLLASITPEQQSPTTSPETTDALGQELQATEKTKQSIEAKLRQIEMVVTTLSNKIESLKETLTNLKTEVQDLEAEKQHITANDSESPDQEKEITISLAELDAEISTVETAIANTKKQLLEETQKEQEQKQALYSLQQKALSVQQNLNTLNNKLTACEIALAKHQTKLEDTKINAENAFGKPFAEIEIILNQTQLPEQQEISELYKKIQDLTRKKEIIGTIDDETRAEYHETQERHEWLTHQTEDLTQAIISLKEVIADLDKKINIQFTENLKNINEKFSHYFSVLFNGGNAELKLIEDTADDEDNETTQKNTFVSGIDIMATPPGKRLTTITMLSGGEKALTSIALICAIIANNNSPFVVLDEVDAALDEANSARFAAILEELSAKTQFIVVTHNRATMEKAQLLYGVTMGDDGVSKLLSIKLEEGSKYANR